VEVGEAERCDDDEDGRGGRGEVAVAS